MTDPEAGRWLNAFWTPVVAVTAAAGDERGGQIAVSVHGAGIVPARPRLTVALWKGNYTRDLVERAGAFAVHLLRDDQDALVYRLGLEHGHGRDKLDGLAWTAGATGTPLLADCLARFECRVINHMDGGDMSVFLGEVVAAETRADGQPLWQRDLRARMPAAERARFEAQTAAHIAQSLRLMDRIER